MTRRQLRVYFAIHELHERRRYTITDETTSSRDRRPIKPSYTVEELARLVGGSGSSRAHAELRADVRALARLGLVTLTRHTVEFAVSADQIKLDDLSGFWAMFDHMPNRRRSVPVPRRTLRALAAGFSKGTTALVIAMLIRGLFWHKGADGSGGDYRIDGRYKLTWVAEHFGISRRAATDARTTLIGLGWLVPIEVTQWELNRWGLRDRIVPEWAPAKENDAETDQGATAGAVGGSDESAGSDAKTARREAFDPGRIATDESATPNAEIHTESASPDLTESLSLQGDLKTRRLPTRGASGVSPCSTGRQGSRKRRARQDQSGNSRRTVPSIRDVKAEDLVETGRLLTLYDQACELGLASKSEAGKLAFFSLAERARSRGKRAGALFYWLLREKKTEFITLGDEDEAARRLREHRYGSQKRGGSGGVVEIEAKPTPIEFDDDDRVVMVCLKVANSRGIEDPFRVAMQHPGVNWTRDEWDNAHARYLTKRMGSTPGQGAELLDEPE